MTFGAYVACIIIAYMVGYWTGRGLVKIKLRNAIQYQLSIAQCTRATNVLNNLLARTLDA
jgi:heme O synthase-like polyprenyltransferase